MAHKIEVSILMWVQDNLGFNLFHVVRVLLGLELLVDNMKLSVPK